MVLHGLSLPEPLVMDNVFERGSSHVTERLGTVGSVAVTYKRGDNEVSLMNVVLGETPFRITRGDKSNLYWSEKDFLIPVDGLIINGELVEPQEGDLILLKVRDVLKTYEVWAPQGEQVWRYSDPEEFTYRIHTKKRNIV